MDEYGLRDWLRLLRKVVLAFGVILSFFAILEILRAYQTLYFFHPYVGYAFLGAIIVGVIWLVTYLFRAVASRPSVLKPPTIVDPNDATKAELQTYSGYLIKYARRLGENENLPINARERILAGTSSFESSFRKANAKNKLEVLQWAEQEVIEPTVSELDEIAKEHVRTCVRDVSIGVTLSPWRAADLFIVLYRNSGMVLRIIRTYNSRPQLLETIAVARDVLRVVAHVNITNFSAKLIEGLFKWVPVLGKYTDEIAQGAGAGLLTSMAGHATIHRCRAFRGWGHEEAIQGIAVHAGNYMRDVRGLITKDIIPKMKSRIVPEEKRDQEAEILKQITSGVSKAFDETAKDAESFVDKPVPVIRTKVAPASTALGRIATMTASTSAAVGRTAIKGGKVTLRGAGKGAGFIGRYTASLWRKRKERLQNKK
ncbi:MAG: YcjF family protein [bacterium]|nr:YcjF family protein [bacterium]